MDIETTDREFMGRESGNGLDTLFRLYRPNVGGGNLDAPARARNEGLREAALVLGLTTTEGWEKRRREIDNEAYERSERSIARLHAEDAARAAKKETQS